MKIRVLFCGTPNIASNMLEELLMIEQIEVVGVVSQPDKIVGRKKELINTPTKIVALKNNIKVFQPNKITEIYDDLAGLNIDYMVTCAYGQIISEKILNLFKNCINVHASLLPKYRGGAPIQYAILNGDKETGISLMKMVKKMDAGEVYVQDKIVIEDFDNNGTLFQKMSVLGRKMLNNYLLKIFNNEITGVPQDENLVTFSPTITSEQEKIDWNKSAYEIHNHIRALNPSPIAYTLFNGQRWKIEESEIFISDNDFLNFSNGQIISIDNKGILVKTNENSLLIKRIQRFGKKMVDAFNFKDQSILKVNDLFE